MNNIGPIGSDALIESHRGIIWKGDIQDIVKEIINSLPEKYNIATWDRRKFEILWTKDAKPGLKYDPFQGRISIPAYETYNFLIKIKKLKKWIKKNWNKFCLNKRAWDKKHSKQQEEAEHQEIQNWEKPWEDDSD